MKNWWLKLGCFLTGYNYNILMVSGETSAKVVKRYTSALLIVCLLWSVIGYTFSNRYLKLNYYWAIGGAILFCLIIIQIERQIILSSKNKLIFYFRGLIAVTMALIGSLIIDQVIFKDDIEQQNISLLKNKTADRLKFVQAPFQLEIGKIDANIKTTNKNIDDYKDSITKNSNKKIPVQTPFITSRTVSVTDANGVTRSVTKPVTKIITEYMPAVVPEHQLLVKANAQLAASQTRRQALQDSLIKKRVEVEKEYRGKIGFLDELKAMYSVICSSWIVAFVWLLWIFFLLGIELFIMISKMGETENDYDLNLQYQEHLNRRKLEVLSGKTIERKQQNKLH